MNNKTEKIKNMIKLLDNMQEVAEKALNEKEPKHVSYMHATFTELNRELSSLSKEVFGFALTKNPEEFDNLIDSARNSMVFVFNDWYKKDMQKKQLAASKMKINLLKQKVKELPN